MQQPFRGQHAHPPGHRKWLAHLVLTAVATALLGGCAPATSSGSTAVAAGFSGAKCPDLPKPDLRNAISVRADALAGGDGSANRPLRTINDALARARAGQTVRVLAGTYRETITLNKPVFLAGERGAIVKGSDIVSGWSRDGSNWSRQYAARAAYSTWSDGYQICRPGSDGRCRLPDQVFLNGKPLRQRTSLQGLRTGEFYAGDGKLYLADNPNGATVEVTSRATWLKASDGLANVGISGIAFTHAAPQPQRGALTVSGANWLLESNEVSQSATVGVETFGSCVTVRGNRIHDNGQLGIKGETPNLVVDANDIYSNNTEEFDPNWEAGGSKWVRSRNLLLVNNRAFDNDGNGLWCDIDCSGVTIRGNRAYENTHNGIKYEISEEAIIEDNDAWLNGAALHDWATGAGIEVLNSRNVTVRNNLVAWNQDGISILQAERGFWTPVYNVTVVNNTIIQAASRQGDAHALAWYGTSIADSGANNRALGNRFWISGPDVLFAWGNGKATSNADSFFQTPGGFGSSILDNSTRNSLLAAKSIPTNPR